MRAVLFVLLAGAVAAPAAEAQILEPSPRLVQPRRIVRLNPNRPVTTMGLQLDILGGYNHNEVPPDALTPSVNPRTSTVNFRPSSYTGSGNASLLYTRTTGSRSITVGGSGAASGYSNVEGAAGTPLYSSSGNVGFNTALGRSGTLALTQNINRSPYMAFGLFSQQSVGNIVYDADGNPVNGLIDGYTVSMNTSASIGRSFGRGSGLTFIYGYQRRNESRTSNNTPDFYQNDHSGTLGYTQTVTRTLGINASYHVTSRQARQVGIARDDIVHGGLFGLQGQVALGRTRNLSYGAGGGADLVDTQGFSEKFWQPQFYARIGVDVARSWVVSANYTQSSSVVHSVVSAPDSYLMQSAVISMRGGLNRRMDVVFAAGVTRGDVSAVHSVTGAAGDFSGYTTSGQLRTALTQRWSAIVSGNYYRSQLTGSASQFLQTSGDFQRTSVRVGMSWSIPIYDNSPR